MKTDNTNNRYDGDQRIELFLRGRMTADDERDFMASLRTNRLLRERAIAAARLTLAMKEVGCERDRIVAEALLSATRDDIAHIARRATDTPRDTGTTQHSTLMRRRMLGVASVAIVLMAMSFPAKQYLDYRAVTLLADRYAQTFAHSDFMRSGAPTDADRELAQLYDNVLHSRRLSATTERLAVLWQVAQADVYNDYADSRDEIGWQLAIAWLKQNRKDKAADILTTLARKTPRGSAINTEATRLLHEIEQI